LNSYKKRAIPPTTPAATIPTAPRRPESTDLNAADAGADEAAPLAAEAVPVRAAVAADEAAPDPDEAAEDMLVALELEAAVVIDEVALVGTVAPEETTASDFRSTTL
jgi:hypothetical protein